MCISGQMIRLGMPTTQVVVVNIRWWWEQAEGRARGDKTEIDPERDVECWVELVPRFIDHPD